MLAIDCSTASSPAPEEPLEPASAEQTASSSPDSVHAHAPALSSDANPVEELLPTYTCHPDANQPRLPSYARATRRPSRPPMTPEERLASLHAFIEEKMYVDDDYFGGLKGRAEGPPTNPLKPFRWMSRKLRGEKGVWKKLTDEERQKWEAEGGPVNAERGEIARGDMDTSRII